MEHNNRKRIVGPRVQSTVEGFIGT